MHVPGHKNMTIGLLKNLDFKMDMTEISGLDDLHHPEEIILDSMAQFNKHQDYNAYRLMSERFFCNLRVLKWSNPFLVMTAGTREH